MGIYKFTRGCDVGRDRRVCLSRGGVDWTCPMVIRDGIACMGMDGEGNGDFGMGGDMMRSHPISKNGTCGLMMKSGIIPVREYGISWSSHIRPIVPCHGTGRTRLGGATSPHAPGAP